MLVNFKFKFKNTKGEEFSDGLSAAESLGEMLATQRTEGITPGKAMHWVNQLYHTGKLDVDSSDVDLLEKFINNLNRENKCVNLIAHPLLEALKKSKDEKEAKEKTS